MVDGGPPLGPGGGPLGPLDGGANSARSGFLSGGPEGGPEGGPVGGPDCGPAGGSLLGGPRRGGPFRGGPREGGPLGPFALSSSSSDGGPVGAMHRQDLQIPIKLIHAKVAIIPTSLGGRSNVYSIHPTYCESRILLVQERQDIVRLH